MELKKLHVGTVSYGTDSMEEVARILRGDAQPKSPLSTPLSTQRGRREITSRVKDADICSRCLSQRHSDRR